MKTETFHFILDVIPRIQLEAKDFVKVIEESFSSGEDKIVVWKNKAGQRMFTKEYFDTTLKKILWEVLSPSDLGNLEIQESHIQDSYNLQIYRERGWAIEESVPEDEAYWTDERISEDPQGYSKFLANKRKIGVTKGGQTTIHHIVHKEKGGEDDFATKLGKKAIERLQTQARKLGIEDVDVKTEDEVHALMRSIKLAQEQPDGGDPVGKGGQGYAPLHMQDGNAGEGFDSVEELIESLRSRERKGDAEATAIINKLYKKGFEGQVETGFPFKMMTHKGRIKPDGTEEGLIEGLRREWRERKKKEREE